MNRIIKPFKVITNMKKLLFAALMLLSTSAVFAGDSEPLKAILKAQTYAEALDLLKANLAQILTMQKKQELMISFMSLQ